MATREEIEAISRAAIERLVDSLRDEPELVDSLLALVPKFQEAGLNLVCVEALDAAGIDHVVLAP